MILVHGCRGLVENIDGGQQICRVHSTMVSHLCAFDLLIKTFTLKEGPSALEGKVFADNDTKELQALSVGCHGISRH